MAARKSKKTKGPTPVEAITHADKRANLPTADAHEFVRPEDEVPVPLRYPRDTTLDPQLVWKGKDELDGEDLVADAPPIYIQEKVDPRVLVENLRETAARPEDEPELTLFESFDGLDELDLVEFYRHDANWSNRMILGDSLNVMASLTEREALRGKVQMIYIDPPYGIKFNSNWQVSARKRDVKDGRLQDTTREVEQIKAFRDTWELGIHSYLSYLRDRLMVAKELLTESGSVFVQIGDENVHLVRSLMDEVFGSENFVSQIAFQKTESQTAGELASVIDHIIWYAVDAKRVKYRQLYLGKQAGGVGATGYTLVEDPDGSVRNATKDELAASRAENGGRLMDGTPLVSQSGSETTRFPVEFGGRTYTPKHNFWKTNETGFGRLLAARRIVALGNRLEYIRYFDDFPVYPIANLWTGMGERGFVGDKWYVVQTAARVIQRCMLMCTDPSDLVLDPTCGSGTTPYVAEQWGR
ncbi:MAG: site-specific DNA-methyltransferase, partial [Haloechinothrix sp.]